MSNKIITISREYGSGGRDIAKAVADKLGIPCYDQSIIERIAEESGYTSDFVAERSEAMPYKGWIGNALALGSGNDAPEQLWTAQCKVLRDIAAEGSCVIVGRCADRVLEGDFDVISVFIHADKKIRYERAINSYGEAAENIEKRVESIDKRRKAYYELYTDSEWGNAENHTVTLDSGKLGTDKCIEIIASLF